MESLREFKVTFYMDSNKRTARKTFDLYDYYKYGDLDEMLNDIKEFVNRLIDERIVDGM